MPRMLLKASVRHLQIDNQSIRMLSRKSEYVARSDRMMDYTVITIAASSNIKKFPGGRIGKRIIDLFLSLSGLILFSPLLLLISVAIIIDDGLPVFFVQRRALTADQNGFNLIKFRSMKRDAEQKQRALCDKNRTTGDLLKFTNNLLVTSTGKFLRNHSLDEMPQLINVLKGEMSLVGPRPLSLEELKNIAGSNRFSAACIAREYAKPGITGLWQVSRKCATNNDQYLMSSTQCLEYGKPPSVNRGLISERDEAKYDEMLELDFYYIQHWSLMYDLKIVLKTIPLVVFGRK